MASASQLGSRTEMASLMAKSNELKQRILYLLGALIVFRLGTHIPVPGVDALALSMGQQDASGGLMAMLNMFSGGAIGRMSIFALGIMPYITASIIMMLMAHAFPTLGDMRKEGELGKRKFMQYTRYLTVLIAFGQGFGMSGLWESMTVQLGAETVTLVLEPGLWFRLQSALMLMTGAVFIMWLAERITVRGLGNGATILIFAGIIAELPAAVYQVTEQARVGAMSDYLSFAVIAIAIITTFVVVYMEMAQRRVLVQYPKRNTQMAGQGEANFMPLKVNTAGVMPAIFASSLLVLPTQLASMAPDAAWAQFIGAYFAPGTIGYMAFFGVLIFSFCYMWVGMQFNPNDVADNLKKSNGFIPGIRPGKSTADYFDYVMARITLVGASYMVIICILPQLIINQFNIPAAAAYLMGGTSLLIVVNVTIDLVTRIQTHLIAQKYDSLLKKSQFRRKTKGA